MTWAFHQLFDGLNTIDEVSGHFDIPLIALKPSPLFCSEDYTTVAYGRVRKCVNIIVYCRHRNVSDVVGPRLKCGSKKVSDTQWKTCVYVYDPTKFTRYLEEI